MHALRDIVYMYNHALYNYTNNSPSVSIIIYNYIIILLYMQTSMMMSWTFYEVPEANSNSEKY